MQFFRRLAALFGRPTVKSSRSPVTETKILDCRVVDAQAVPETTVIYMVPEEEAIDGLTIFCFAFSISAVLFVTALLVAVILELYM